MYGNEPYDEFKWRDFSIGGTKFHVEGGCDRCVMVNINQKTGEKSPELFHALTQSDVRELNPKRVGNDVGCSANCV